MKPSEAIDLLDNIVTGMGIQININIRSKVREALDILRAALPEAESKAESKADSK